MWNEGPVPEALSGFPGYLMARLGQLSARRFREALEPFGLHPRQFGILNIVASHPGCTQQRLRELTAIDASSMVSAIDELERAGLAERRSHPDDRRARAIYITERGTAQLLEVRELAQDVQRELFASLTPKELETLHRLLIKLASQTRQAGERQVAAPPA